jgi:hypothetical protein
VKVWKLSGTTRYLLLFTIFIAVCVLAPVGVLMSHGLEHLVGLGGVSSFLGILVAGFSLGRPPQVITSPAPPASRDEDDSKETPQ